MRAADGRFLKGSHWRPAAPHWGAVWLREQYEGLGRSAGDIVFDPFLGSGTVAQVAQRLGRHWVGCELNPEYIDLQHDRTRQRGLVLES